MRSRWTRSRASSAPVDVECHLYRESSTAFFEHRDVRKLLGGHGPSLVLLDGPRAFAAVLEDFWRVEAVADPGTVLAIPDTIPYDEVTQRATCTSTFHSGDVWKLLHCLAAVRPELSWFTVRAAPCGLTFVHGLDPASTVLRDRFPELLEQFGLLPFEVSLDPPGAILENDWDLVAARLQARVVGAATPGGEVGPEIEGSTESSLSRRVRELEERERARRAEAEELGRALAAANEALRTRDATAEATAAELEALRSTKLYRWTRPLRRVVARARHHGEVA